MSHLRRRGGRADQGSIAIEFVLVVPLLIFVTVLLVQGLIAVSVIDDVTKAARDGARAAARGSDGSAAANAALPGWVDVESVVVGPGAVPGCAGVCSRVTVNVPLGFPGLVELGSFQITRTADMPRS